MDRWPLYLAILLWPSALPAASAAPCRREPVPVFNVEDGLVAKGYDVVAYFSDGRPVPGSSRFSLRWRGAIWQFASASHRAAFQRRPERYAPQYGGYCAFAMSQGRVVDIDPRQWKTEHGRLYLNANRLAQYLWLRDPDGHIKKADAVWPALRRRGR